LTVKNGIGPDVAEFVDRANAGRARSEIDEFLRKKAAFEAGTGPDPGDWYPGKPESDQGAAPRAGGEAPGAGRAGTGEASAPAAGPQPAAAAPSVEDTILRRYGHSADAIAGMSAQARAAAALCPRQG
jgi:hypothetical protein